MLKGGGLFSEEYGTIFCHDSASLQYDTRVCITLCHPSNNAGHNAIQLKDSLRFLPLCCTHAGACCNATKRKDRLLSYPSIPLCYVLVSGHEKQ